MAKGGRGGRRAGGGGSIFFDPTGASVQSLGLAGQTVFFNGNETSVQRTVEGWENKSRNLDHEELLMVNEDGFAVGYFKGDKGSVGFSVPEGTDMSKITLTHNHPTTGNDRTIGGSFSNADLQNHIRLGIKETRATSSEGTYSFKTTSESNSQGFLKALSTRQSTVSKAVEQQVKAMQKKGIKLTSTEHTDLYLKACDSWYKNTAYQYGYEYQFTAK